MELDLGEAVEAGATELLQAWHGRTGERMRINESARAEVDDLPDGWCLECSGVDTAALRASTLAVRAAAPIIERAVREQIGQDLDEWTETLRHNYRTGNYDYNGGGIEYINGIEAASARIAQVTAADPPPSIGRTGAIETGGETDG